MRRPVHPSLAVPLVIGALALTGCNSKPKPAAAVPSATASVASVPTVPASEPAAVATQAALSGSPSTDPCRLVPANLAAQLLTVPVGPARRYTLKGASACMYTATSSKRVILLATTYAGPGRALLAQAGSEHADAKDVGGVGDAAKVSRRDSVIGVVVQGHLFTLAMLRPDVASTSPEQIEAQLVSAARTVLARA
jgi:hypothetical protein